jgi:hypothetical protein
MTALPSQALMEFIMRQLPKDKRSKKTGSKGGKQRRR